MLDAVVEPGSRCTGLRGLDGVEYLTDGAVTVGMHAHSPAGGVHLPDQVGEFDPIDQLNSVLSVRRAGVCFAAEARPAAQRPVVHHLDADESETLVTEAGTDPELADGVEIGAPQQHPHART